AGSERLRDRFPQRNPHVLDGVMLIDVEIAADGERHIERSMASEELEHVIEEADAGGDVVSAAALDAELQANWRLARLPRDYGAAHRTSSKAAAARRVSSTRPAVIRMHPAQPCSGDRSRTRTPRSASAATMRATSGPTMTSMKLAALGQVRRPSREQASERRALDSAACAQYQSR